MTIGSHDSDKRQAILRAAEEVFVARGYAATTMESVAEMARVAKGSLYNYFQNKQDLFVQVLNEAMVGGEEIADDVVASEASASEKLLQLLDDWYARLEHYQRVGGLMLECWAAAVRGENAGPLSGSIEQMTQRWHARITRIVEQGICDGEFRSVLQAPLAARLILAVGDGAMIQTIMRTNLSLDSEFLDAYKRAMLTVLTGRVVDPESEGHSDGK